MKTKTIKAQSLRHGHVLVFGNGQKRKLMSTTKTGAAKRTVKGGQTVGLVMHYIVPTVKPLPGVYHPRTGAHYASIEDALKAGEKVVEPAFWVRWDGQRIREVRFAWSQTVTVLA